MFDKYEPTEIEKEILDFWEKNKIYDKAKAKNKGKKSYYFLDGPPYTSGRIHLGQAWNKALMLCLLAMGLECMQSHSAKNILRRQKNR